LGLFDDPYKYCDEEREKETTGKPSFQEAVLDVAKKSIVLLKNEGALLPLKKSGQKIALIGALAADKDSPLGSWRLAAETNTAISVLEGMQAYKGNTLTYAKGADLTIGATAFIREVKINEDDRSAFAKAIEVAKDADVVVMVLGEHGFQSGEGRSRSELDLPGVQQELLEAVYKVNKNIVLVLNNGRPLAINWAAEHIPTIVEAWHLGTQSGHAVAQVLYGDYNPSGKLPMTFPRAVGQVPLYYNHLSTGRPNELSDDLVFWSHYSDLTNSPLYPFGHGLSYTSFLYENLEVAQSNEGITVSVTVTNTGKVTGKEVVQVYINDVVASVARPVKELKGFEMISLEPAASQRVTMTLTIEELGFYTNNGVWTVESGLFKVFVGGSSVTTLQSEIEYQKK
jgi:beta-glucosidase